MIFTRKVNDKDNLTSVFQVTSVTVDEPDFNTHSVYLPVIRNAGTLGHVVVQWMATVNGELASGDLRITSGNMSFAAGETIQTLLIEIMADNIPEIEEVSRIESETMTYLGLIGEVLDFCDRIPLHFSKTTTSLMGILQINLLMIVYSSLHVLFYCICFPHPCHLN